MDTIMTILTSASLDDLENRLILLKILVFVVFIGIPILKLFFGKKE